MTAAEGGCTQIRCEPPGWGKAALPHLPPPRPGPAAAPAPPPPGARLWHRCAMFCPPGASPTATPGPDRDSPPPRAGKRGAAGCGGGGAQRHAASRRGATAGWTERQRPTCQRVLPSRPPAGAPGRALPAPAATAARPGPLARRPAAQQPPPAPRPR